MAAKYMQERLRRTESSIAVSFAGGRERMLRKNIKNEEQRNLKTSCRCPSLFHHRLCDLIRKPFPSASWSIIHFVRVRSQAETAPSECFRVKILSQNGNTRIFAAHGKRQRRQEKNMRRFLYKSCENACKIRREMVLYQSTWAVSFMLAGNDKNFII